MMKKKLLFICLVSLSINAISSKLVELTVLDKNYIQLYFRDGETTFKDDGKGKCPHDHCEDLANNDYVAFGQKLNTTAVQVNNNFTITSSDDGTFSTGLNPEEIYRKSKLTAMTWRSMVSCKQ